MDNQLPPQQQTPEELAAKIAAMRTPAKWEDKPNEPHASSSVALNMVAELVATLAVGGVGGYYLDAYFNTTPALLLCGLLLGGLAGMIGIKRINDAYVRNLENEPDVHGSENNNLENDDK